jgi:hypothetical protein
MTALTGKLKSVRNRNSLVLHVVLLALFTLTRANATFNAPYALSQTQSATTSYVDFDDDNCANGITGLGGIVTNSGLGLSLNGGASFNNSNGEGGYSCYMGFVWQGTASGTIGTTATISANILFTLTNVVTYGCTLTVYANGSQVAQYNCVPSSGTTFTLTNQSFMVPANWTTYEVLLATSATLTFDTLSSFSVGIPGEASIDIGTVSVATATVPALSPTGLGTTAIMLALLAGYATLRRAKASGGFPGDNAATSVGSVPPFSRGTS